MYHRPVIGIPMQTLQAIDGIPEGLPTSWVMNQRYIHTLTAVGGVPWMIPVSEVEAEEGTLREIYERLDGVFLSGGVDMDPGTYGEPQHPLCGRTDPARDRSELLLTYWAIEDAKPVLGVCRGLQVINVAYGGSLYQDLADQHPEAIKHDYFPHEGYARDYLAHSTEIVADTLLASIVGGEEIMVNSMHHQGVKKLGEGLIASAVAPDGLIEGLESTSKDHFLLGIQWHPEMLAESCERTRRLFEGFIAATRRWRQHPPLAMAV